MRKLKRKSKKFLLVTVLTSLLLLTGCQNVRMWFKDFQQSFKGLHMTIRTYDDESQIIDEVKGKSVYIERDKDFDTDDETKDSSVLRITVGGKELHHVGSSMIVEEEGLHNVFDDYRQKHDLKDLDSSLPIVNKMVDEFRNQFTGKKKVVLIRSQRGYPLATYSGDKVSLYQTDVPKSTGILIDNHYLFIYRCDYTIYDTSLLDD
ncbi:DUF5052 family protein [Vagococcus humatus]|uniref:DUF5052 domain-containing protein n=1 Tax=Vagococcus humatus TaxID=1889241 RepID=A0A3S0AB24_9ENTE|nr:DUF5052 family protein [Vagococcus humatus]RST88718.1 DUF5052 domain-containing protein [Vagococcus humatus]